MRILTIQGNTSFKSYSSSKSFYKKLNEIKIVNRSYMRKYIHRKNIIDFGDIKELIINSQTALTVNLIRFLCYKK